MPRSLPACLLLALACLPAASAADPPRVEYRLPEPAVAGSQRNFAGLVVAPDSATLAPAVGGIVRKVHADVGDRVARGALLLELDDELAQLELDRARAAESAARVAHAEAMRLHAEARELARRGDFSASQLQALAAQAATAEAQLALAVAERRRAEALLARHRLHAPFAGSVTFRAAAPGAHLSAGDDAFRLVADSPLTVRVHLPQDAAGRIAAGAAAEIALPGMTMVPISGTVEAISAAADPTSGTAVARIRPQAGSEALRPGQSVRVTVTIPPARAALAIPATAVRELPDGGHYVWLVVPTPDGAIAQRRRVELAALPDEQALVVAGLSTDERVVVRADGELRDGQAVHAERAR